jgi:hypothetical protein
MTTRTYSELVLVVDVRFLKSFRQELLGAVGARKHQVLVGRVGLREVAPDVGHRAPALLQIKHVYG